MKHMSDLQKLRKHCFGAETFSKEVLEWIEKENLWNLWVPKNYGGLEMTLSEGLRKLKTLSAIDGSLGWTITLCSGANYFIGNLSPEAAEEIFAAPNKPILGGSGAVSGTAEKRGENYIISGKWRFATGATYLTHFTLNAKILENGKEVKNEDGSQKIFSFVLPKKDVTIIEDWNTMGLKATVTHSFEVEEAQVPSRFSFMYDLFYLPQPVFRINFSVFADLTLWVNYLGMAEHFYEEASKSFESEKIKLLKNIISEATNDIFRFAEEIEKKTLAKYSLDEVYTGKIHQRATTSVQQLSAAIVQIHPSLGVKAVSTDQPLNQIFRDYFTATQHHIFVEK